MGQRERLEGEGKKEVKLESHKDDRWIRPEEKNGKTVEILKERKEISQETQISHQSLKGQFLKSLGSVLVWTEETEKKFVKITDNVVQPFKRKKLKRPKWVSYLNLNLEQNRDYGAKLKDSWFDNNKNGKEITLRCWDIVKPERESKPFMVWL